MNITIFGLGYVGCVTAACLADSGHTVVGIDISDHKLDLLRSGMSPVVEPGMRELIATQVASGGLSVTSDIDGAIEASDISLVCVGTPSNVNGSLDLSHVRAVCEQIGSALAARERHHVVVIRSTMLPGSIYDTVLPALESASGEPPGERYSVAVNPEFLREGTAIQDYVEPPFTLVGSDDPRAIEALKSMYKGISAPFLEVSARDAEMVKYSCNCFHAVKVAFANEIGNLCKSSGIDSHVVMDVFCKDEKLNLSSYYLRPGFAFGGSCLPKDLRAITYNARVNDVDVPLLASVLASNERQVMNAFDRIEALGVRRVAFLGLSFKVGTDDLRESPTVTLAERLIGRGYTLRIYDEEVQVARLVGSNRSYIDSEIPHLAALLENSMESAISNAELIVVCKQDPSYVEAVNSRPAETYVLDLVRLHGVNVQASGYDGISW